MTATSLDFGKALNAPVGQVNLDFTLFDDPGLRLRFKGPYAPPAGGNVPIIFGTPPPDVPGAQITLAAILPGLAAAIQIDKVAEVSIQATLPSISAEVLIERVIAATINAVMPAMAAAVDLTYDNNVWRGLLHSNQVGWDVGAKHISPLTGSFENSQRTRTDTILPWGEGEPLQGERAQPWSDLDTHPAESGLAWGAGQSLGRGLASKSEPLAGSRRDSAMPWKGVYRRSGSTGSRYSHPGRSHRHYTHPWGRGGHVAQQLGGAFGPGLRWQPGFLHPWREGRPWHPDVSIPLPVPLPPPPYQYVPTPDAPFLCPLILPSGQVIMAFGEFACPLPGQKPPSIPVTRVYWIMNTVNVTRLSDGAPIAVSALSLSIDHDSWAWQFQATLASKAALELVASTGGNPVEVQIEINGHIWTALVESYQRTARFGQPSYQITGRSLSAYLADPYAASRSKSVASPATAAQLAGEELLYSGWNLNWATQDWLVSAGAFSYQDLTPIAVIGRIAQAVDGVIQPHPSSKTLEVKARYPVSPWQWSGANPDLILPDSILTGLSTRLNPKPTYNAVFVSGQQVGVIAKVLRTGSAGDLAAPMIVDALVTQVDAARERGRNRLSNTGRQALVSLELPLTESPSQPGLVLPGKLIEVQESGEAWRGLVVGTSIGASRNNGLSIQQRVDVERHF